jgi:hypothetical protein
VPEKMLHHLGNFGGGRNFCRFRTSHRTH